MKNQFATTFILIMMIFPVYGISQNQQILSDSAEVKIELSDKSVLYGTILSEDDQNVHFRTHSGVDMTISKNNIVKREIIAGMRVEGKFLRYDPNRTRLFFAPTGRALRMGQGYFSVYQIFFPFVAVGVTDYLTLAGGLSLFPFAENQLLYLAPKITPLQMEKFDLSAGVLFIHLPGEDDAVGIVYGVSTYGTRKASLTLGLGFAYAGGDIADKPVFAIGGEYQTSGNTKIISENWIIPDSDVQFLSFGWRFFGENLAADFGLVYPAGSDSKGFPFIPWVGFAYNFGKIK